MCWGEGKEKRKGGRHSSFPEGEKDGEGKPQGGNKLLILEKGRRKSLLTWERRKRSQPFDECTKGKGAFLIHS